MPVPISDDITCSLVETRRTVSINYLNCAIIFTFSSSHLALAFCDWSDVQKTRRDMLSSHTFPRTYSMGFNRLNDITIEHIQQISYDIKRTMDGKSVSIKPIILSACANIFTEYFTTRTFEPKDPKF